MGERSVSPYHGNPSLALALSGTRVGVVHEILTHANPPVIPEAAGYSTFPQPLAHYLSPPAAGFPAQTTASAISELHPHVPWHVHCFLLLPHPKFCQSDFGKYSSSFILFIRRNNLSVAILYSAI